MIILLFWFILLSSAAHCDYIYFCIFVFSVALLFPFSNLIKFCCLFVCWWYVCWFCCCYFIFYDTLGPISLIFWVSFLDMHALFLVSFVIACHNLHFFIWISHFPYCRSIAIINSFLWYWFYADFFGWTCCLHGFLRVDEFLLFAEFGLCSWVPIGLKFWFYFLYIFDSVILLIFFPN